MKRILFNRKTLLFFLFFSGLLLRLLIMFFDRRGDVNNHFTWAREIALWGFSGLFEKDFEFPFGTANANYPPIAFYLFYLFYKVYFLTQSLIWQINIHVGLFPSSLIEIFNNPAVLPDFMKIPAILSDVGIAWLIYIIAKRQQKLKNLFNPILLASFILFNPAFFYNSAYWGQIDSIPIFFILLSLYLLLYTKHSTLSLISFTLSLLSKQTAIIFLPIFIILSYKKMGIKKTLIAFFISLIIFLTAFYPFYQKGHLLIFPFVTYLYKILMVSGNNYVTDHAFNFWRLIVGDKQIPDATRFFSIITYNLVGYLITGFFLIVVLIKSLKKKILPENVFLYFYLVAFFSFLFLTRIHERHLLQALPFLLLTVSNRSRLAVFIFLSLFNFLNLYHDWWSPPLFFASLVSNSLFINICIFILIIIFIRQFIQLIITHKHNNITI